MLFTPAPPLVSSSLPLLLLRDFVEVTSLVDDDEVRFSLVFNGIFNAWPCWIFKFCAVGLILKDKRSLCSCLSAIQNQTTSKTLCLRDSLERQPPLSFRNLTEITTTRSLEDYMHLPSTYSLYNKSNPARMRCMCMQSVHTRKIIGMEADRKIMNKYDDLSSKFRSKDGQEGSRSESLV